MADDLKVVYLNPPRSIEILYGSCFFFLAYHKVFCSKGISTVLALDNTYYYLLLFTWTFSFALDNLIFTFG